jgi:hypothetical protein
LRLKRVGARVIFLLLCALMLLLLIGCEKQPMGSEIKGIYNVDGPFSVSADDVSTHYDAATRLVSYLMESLKERAPDRSFKIIDYKNISLDIVTPQNYEKNSYLGAIPPREDLFFVSGSADIQFIGEFSPIGDSGAVPKGEFVNVSLGFRYLKKDDGCDTLYNAQEYEKKNAEKEPVYFIIEGSLLGAICDGNFISLNDVGGEYGGMTSEKFYFKDIFALGPLKSYEKSGEMGTVSELMFSTGYGISGLASEVSEEAINNIKKYAKTVYEDVGSSHALFSLPTFLGPECDDIYIPDYGFTFWKDFKEDKWDGNLTPPLLLTNGKNDMRIKNLSWEGPVSKEDGEFIEEFFKSFNFEITANFTDIITGDFDFDGKDETILVANSIRDENGYVIVSEGESGGYSTVILKDDGNYEILYSRTIGREADVISHFRVLPIGFFDLNRDGQSEVILNVAEWEEGHTIVLSRDELGAFQTVMRNNWGM